jgi:hypothetical protein
MDIVVHDANELDAIAGALARAEHDLYWTLKPLEFGQGAVPWQRGTQDQWRRIRNQLNRELGLMAGEARELRDRANRTRWEAFRTSFFASAPSWLSVFAAVPAGIVGFYLGRAVLSAMNAQSVVSVPDPVPPKPNSGPMIIESTIAAKSSASLAADRLAKFKETFLGQKAVSAFEGKSDKYDGECVSLVKRYIRWVDKTVEIPSITPSSPGGAYGSNWTKVTIADGEAFRVRAGDIVYLNYAHVAVATSDQQADGTFHMIESHGWVRDPSKEGGGYTPEAKNSVVQMTSQNSSRVRAIMRPTI